MRSKNKKLTSVRVEPELFSKFKEVCIKEDFTFQKLADRSIFLYLTDEDFRIKIKNQKEIKL